MKRITEHLTTEEARLLYRVRNVRNGRVNISVTRRRGEYRTITLQRERGEIEIIRDNNSVLDKFVR